MKQPKLAEVKNIIVKLSSHYMYEIAVDSNIFDDPWLEAATQAMEKTDIKKYGVITPIIHCWEKKNENNPKKHVYINSYWVLVNAALYKKAELLREKFMLQTNVDLAAEPVSGTKK